MTRAQKINEFSIEIVLNDEQYWRDKGYEIDYNKSLLKKIGGQNGL
jgi:hypothetical protein